MTDESPVDPTERKRFDIARFVVLSGWIVSVAVCAFLVLSAAYISIVSHQDPPEFLKTLANIALGLLVGLSNLVKDFILPNSSK